MVVLCFAQIFFSDVLAYSVERVGRVYGYYGHFYTYFLFAPKTGACVIVPKIGAHEKYSFVGTLCRTHLFATTPYPQKIGFGVVAARIGGTDECGAFVRGKGGNWGQTAGYL